MATYKDLQDKINLDYLNQTTLVAEVKRAIQGAIRNYETQRFWFNETSTAVALTASQAYLNVPADFMLLDRIEVNYGSGYFPLEQISFSTLRAFNAVVSPNQPTYFAYRGNRFELDQPSLSAYPAVIYYVQQLPVLSADTDTNVWTNEGFNLIAHCAASELLANVASIPNQQKIMRHEQAERGALQALMTRNDVRLVRRITPTTF